MKALAGARALLRAGWARLAAHLDGKPPRERLALAALAVASLGALEVGLIQPVREQRQIVARAVAEQQRAVADAEQARLELQAAEQAALQTRLERVERELSRRGAGPAQAESLAGWLARVLAGQAVRVVSLRDLALQELDTTPASASDPGAPGAGGEPPQDGAPDGAARQHPALYRHRFELTLAGEVGGLASAVQHLGQRMLPLRIERVHLASPDGRSVQATLTFVVIAPERTWITL